jgi:hypothetical protein
MLLSLFKSPIAWWKEQRRVRQELENEAIFYYALLEDISDLAEVCADVPEVEATALWLLRNDLIRRWRPGDDAVPPGDYWGPVETFREQVIVRQKQRRRR